jgi:hypothetical protein
MQSIFIYVKNNTVHYPSVLLYTEIIQYLFSFSLFLEYKGYMRLGKVLSSEKLCIHKINQLQTAIWCT